MPHVVQQLPEIGVTAISRWLFNCYLVHDGGDGRPFVVDLGLPSHVDVVGAELRRLDRALDDLHVVATHGHTDHVGGIPALREAVTPRVSLPAVVAGMLDGSVPPRSPGPREVARILPVIADQPRDLATLRELAPLTKVIGYDGRVVHFPGGADHGLADGEALPGAPAWRVLHTPGHTDDSVSLWCESTRTLISGDAVLSVGGRAWFNPELVDPSRSAATEAQLRSLDVEHLLPGHGRVVQGRVMAEALSFVERPADSGAVTSLRRIFRRHRRPTPEPA